MEQKHEIMVVCALVGMIDGKCIGIEIIPMPDEIRQRLDREAAELNLGQPEPAEHPFGFGQFCDRTAANN